MKNKLRTIRKNLLLVAQRALLQLLLRVSKRGAGLKPEQMSQLADASSSVSHDQLGSFYGLIRELSSRYGESEKRPDDITDWINFAATMRNEWVARKAGQLPKGLSVLDAGAGECQYRDLFEHVSYKTQDFAQYHGTELGPQKEAWNYGQIDYVSDICAIPTPDASFDVVLCTEVLEHVPDPVGAIKEFARVLKPGGCLWMSAPLGSGVHQAPYHYYGGFTRHFYLKTMAELGFDDIVVTPLGGLFRHVAQECHRVGRILVERAAPDVSGQYRYLLTDWLPRNLIALDDEYFVEEFTVGYVIEAKRRRL